MLLHVHTGTSMQVVKKEYSTHDHPQFSFIFSFKNDFVSLKLPDKGELGGWKITPFYDPKVCLLSYSRVLVVLFPLSAAPIDDWRSSSYWKSASSLSL